MTTNAYWRPGGLPVGMKHECHYNAALDCITHILTLNGYCVMFNVSRILTPDEQTASFQAAVDNLLARQPKSNSGTLCISGIVRAKLSPRYDVHPQKCDEFYLRDQQQGIDYALPFRNEARFIEQQTGISITQEEFNGEYRRTSSQVRGAAAQASGGGTGGAGANYSLWTIGTGGPSVPSFAKARERTRLARGEAKIGELVAHRAWLLSEGDLCSVGMFPLKWLPEVPMTDKTLLEQSDIREDLQRDPKGISDYSGEGVWSFKTAKRLMREYIQSDLNGYSKVMSDTRLVLGTCYIWGTIIEHEFGYRSQFASIHSLNSCYRLTVGESFVSPSGLGFHWTPDDQSVEQLRVLRSKYRLRPLDAS